MHGMKSHGCGEHWRTLENARDEILHNTNITDSLFLALISSFSRFANSSSSSPITPSHSWSYRSCWWMIVDISSNKVMSLHMPCPSCVLLAIFLRTYFSKHKLWEEPIWWTFFWLGLLVCPDPHGPGCKVVCNGWALSDHWSPSHAHYWHLEKVMVHVGLT